MRKEEQRKEKERKGKRAKKINEINGKAQFLGFLGALLFLGKHRKC